MVPLLDRPLAEVLDEVAASSPAPGGGSSAAVACALAAGLVQMVAGFDESLAELHERAGALRQEASACAEAELTAYVPVLEALRNTDEPDAVAAALSDAADSVLAIARIAAEVAALGVQAARRGRERLQGDAITGVLLAEAATAAAVRLAIIDLEPSPGDARLHELGQLAHDAARSRAEIQEGK